MAPLSSCCGCTVRILFEFSSLLSRTVVKFWTLSTTGSPLRSQVIVAAGLPLEQVHVKLMVSCSWGTLTTEPFGWSWISGWAGGTAIQYNAIQYQAGREVLQYNTISGWAEGTAIQYNTISGWAGGTAIQYNTIQSQAGRAILQYNTVQYNTISFILCQIHQNWQ